MKNQNPSPSAKLETPAARLARLVIAEPNVQKALANYEGGKFADVSFRDIGLAATEVLSASASATPPAAGEAAHTPAYRFTGLYRQRPDELGPARYFAGIEYGDAGQGFITVLEALGTSPAKALEHAEFFQNKLNSHAALVAALGALEDSISAWEDEEESVQEEHAELIKALKKSAAAARAPSPPSLRAPP